MQHLTLEAIARLVDEAPDSGEAFHLRECLTCRRELEEMRALTGDLAQLADPEPSPRAWAELESRLVEEALVRHRGAAPREYAWLRVAASVSLLVLGGTAGAAIWGRGGTEPARGEPVPLLPVATAPAPNWTPTEASPAPEPEAPAPGLARTVAEEPSAHPAAPRRESNGGAREARRREAAAALRNAERDYLVALAEYARAASEEDADPVTRLATLEGLVRATRYALERAPDDPLINGYHLAAMGQRDAILRQIARSSEETWY